LTNAPRPFLGQVAWVSGGRIGGALIQALSVVLVLRLLDPGEFGLLSGVLSLATISQTAIDMGVATFISRERAARPDSGAIATALRFNAISSLALTGVVLTALVVVWLASGNSIYLYMLPLAFWVSGERNADARLSVVFADGDAKINVINLLARRALSVIVFVVLAAVGVNPVLSFALGSAIAALSSSLFANFYVRRRVTTPPSISYRELLRLSRAYWVHAVASQARNFDVILVTTITGATQAGFYSTASRLTNPLTLLTSSLASTLLPAASRASAVSQSLRPLLRIATVVVGSMSAIYAVIYFAAPFLVTSVLPAEYADTTRVIQFVVAGLPFAAVASILSSVMQGQGHKRFVASTSTLATLTCLALIAVGSLNWGAIGAGAALSVTLCLQAVALCVGFLVLIRRSRREKKTE